MLPIEFEHKKVFTTLELNISLPIAQEERLLHLNSLDEIRKMALERTEIIQLYQKKWNDAHVHNK